MNLKKIARIRRATKLRKNLKKLKMIRLSIHRTSRHIYAQIISLNNKVLVTASTLEKKIREKLTYTGNIKSAIFIGETIAIRAIKHGILNISFDRSGFKYHGRIKALANAARQTGLKF
ncbi:50S ribosomal protein L18 [Enterobacteriaceae endosymbiont of Donacia bicoloricornis]|uniref:50S ribosomal protein L18 n=1 Tax=Enterobacteriaceae endosymbiont of Donacia bicoloricornis TaxID=2675772 RepID=UPI001449E608|nr:50S ribosomal protein L18 [Enterobacteriaceae endosymbiont of Donacia bicoloricornis]QJC37780.1 50S ribosomal protein L18 [Enterobacteriaceae endosymbiont of Donacia bicoloricornis]